MVTNDGEGDYSRTENKVRHIVKMNKTRVQCSRASKSGSSILCYSHGPNIAARHHAARSRLKPTTC